MSSEIPTPFARAAAAVDPMSSAPTADVPQISTEPLPQDDGMEAVRDTPPTPVFCVS